MRDNPNTKEETLTLAIKRPDINLTKLYVSTYLAAFENADGEGEGEGEVPSSHEALAAYFIGVTAGAFMSTDLAPRLAADAVREALFKHRDNLKLDADDLAGLTAELVVDVTKSVIADTVREASQLAACALKETKEEEAAKKSTH